MKLHAFNVRVRVLATMDDPAMIEEQMRELTEALVDGSIIIEAEACEADYVGDVKVRRRAPREAPMTARKAKAADLPDECAACGAPADGDEFSIHRDGFCKGPEVPLCTSCGADETPSCEELWRAIAERRAELVPRRRGR